MRAFAPMPMGQHLQQHLRVLLLLLLGAIASAALAAWVWLPHAHVAAQNERAASATELARGVAKQLNQALGLGIAPQQLVGVSPWFASVMQDNPLVRGVALLDANAAPLYSAGTAIEMPPAELRKHMAQPLPQASAQPSAQPVTFELGQHTAVLLPLRAPNAVAGVAPDAWLLLSAGLLPLPNGFVGLAVGGPLALLALVGLLWMLYLHLCVQKPLASLQNMAESLANQQLPPPAIASHSAQPAAFLRQRWRHWLNDLHTAHSAVLNKTAEVRAAHFDPALVQQLDDLHDALKRWSPPHQQVQALKFTAWQGVGLRTRLGAAAVLVLCAFAAFSAWQLRSSQQLQTQALLQAKAQNQSLVWAAHLQSEANGLQVLLSGVTVNSSTVSVWQSSTVAMPTSTAAQISLMVPGDSVLSHGPDGAKTVPPREVLNNATLSGSQQTTLRGVWLGEDRNLHVGVAVAHAVGDTRYWLVATKPLLASVQALRSTSAAQFVLADLRGQSLGADVDGIAAAWRKAGQISHAGSTAQGEARWVVESGISSMAGRPAASLISAQIPPPALIQAGRNAAWALGLGTVLCVGLLLLWLQRNLLPWARAARHVQALAAADAPSADRTKPSTVLSLPLLEHASATVAAQLNTLGKLQRSRERQGRRQARFMRHQMMGLAQRLDSNAREAVLGDLARIENAAQSTDALVATASGNALAKPINAVHQAVVDEVSVLALGFQSLLGRVGDQYEELGRLVAELRAALLAKTQLIAIQQELEIASKMQLSMLPRQSLELPGLLVSGHMHAAKEVGGDFYDYFQLDEHHVAMAVGDVSGKGVPAAFFMAVSRTLLRALAQIEREPGPCVRRLNDLLAADNDELMFVTLFYAVLDVRTGMLSYANAGHNPPYVLTPQGGVEPIGSLGDMALAVMDGLDYTQGQRQLKPGDGLFIFSDGVTEATSPTQELYAEPRLEALLANQQNHSIAQITAQLLADLQSFEGEGNQADDITVLMLRYQAHSSVHI